MDIDDFLLTKLEIKEIEGRTLAFRYVNFRGTPLPIVGVVSSTDSNFIEYQSRRPAQNFMQSMRYYSSSIQDYFKDLGMIFYGLSEVEELNDNAIFDSATFICASHIKEIGRIIDEDLYSYIDLIVYAKNTIWEKLYNAPLSDQEASNLWVELNRQLFVNLKNFIFLTKYDISNPRQPKPYLVKYSDL